MNPVTKGSGAIFTNAKTNGCAFVAGLTHTACCEVIVTTQLLDRPQTTIDLGLPPPAHWAAVDAVPAPPRPARVLRFLALTAFGAPVNFCLYALLLQFTAASAAAATVLAALCVIVPKFVLSKYWVWKQNSSNNLRQEVLIYFAVTASSLAFATYVGWLLERQGATNAMLVFANLGSFTLMWVLRFVVLDRFAFVSPTHSQSM